MSWRLTPSTPNHLRGLPKNLCHRKGPERKPCNPISMLKAQLLKRLLRIPSDRRLALHHNYGRKAVRECGFRKRTPSNDLSTQLGKCISVNTNLRVFDYQLQGLMEKGAMKGVVFTVVRNHVHAFIQRTSDNCIGKSYAETRVGRGKHGFI